MPSSMQIIIKLRKRLDGLINDQLNSKRLLNEYPKAYYFYTSCMNLIMLISIIIVYNYYFIHVHIYTAILLPIGCIVYNVLNIYIKYINKQFFIKLASYKANDVILNVTIKEFKYHQRLAKHDIIINYIQVDDLCNIVLGY